MKKFFIMLTVVMTICSTAFAKTNPEANDDALKEYIKTYLDCYSGCKLAVDRWEDSGIGNNYKYLRFFDTETITFRTPDVFDVWICDYMTGKQSCDTDECKEAKIDTAKHYHYARLRFDSSAYTCSLLTIMVKDTQNEKIIKSLTFPSYVDTTATIIPESMAEATYRSVQKYLQKKK